MENRTESSHSVVQQQQKDVIIQQQMTIERLKKIIDDKETAVPYPEHKAMVEKLEDEIISHASTTKKLMECEDKLEFVIGENEVLRKQIEREKRQFDMTFGKLRTKALSDTVKAVDLENKVHVIEHQCETQTDILQLKDQQIQNLSKKLQTSKQEHDQKLSEMNIKLQQDLYIARMMEEKDKKSGKRTK